MHSGDVFCKDDSHHCMTISVKSCMMPILAKVCKRSCGLCNNNQLPGFPPLPTQLPGFPPLPQLGGKIFYKS